MAFSPRLAALAAVVAVPLGIAATSYAMTDSPEAPKVPPGVQLDSSPSDTRSGTPDDRGSTGPSAPPTGTPTGPPTGSSGDAVVPGPSAADGDDDDDDDFGDDG
ncbi:small hydrophilic protein [Streptomyces sp. IB2014 016-6]|uniref:small hydrophilic protein n=1 Tax=Streptomyces sp. IB2014 016-6 TaxID=2517818 RepID=UPI0011C90617|nr:small hydrophilic protein [Streptomyces sp. IB2014 016-6]TXL89811.1 small hydrophilic protein [Streptomyces sp. IB2014 016-6]